MKAEYLCDNCNEIVTVTLSEDNPWVISQNMPEEIYSRCSTLDGGCGENAKMFKVEDVDGPVEEDAAKLHEMKRMDHENNRRDR